MWRVRKIIRGLWPINLGKRLNKITCIRLGNVRREHAGPLGQFCWSCPQHHFFSCAQQKLLVDEFSRLRPMVQRRFPNRYTQLPSQQIREKAARIMIRVTSLGTLAL